MRVLRFHVRHVQGVEEVSCEMDGHHLFIIGGKNRSAKTSALQALRMALGGKREMDWPDMPIKDGENSAIVRVELSGDEDMHEPEGFVLELRLNRRRGGKISEELVLMDSTGEPAPEPRKLLKQLFHFRGFDPLAFDRAKPKEQAEIIRKLLGLDFAELDSKRAAAYAKRTDVNRDLKRAEASRASIKVLPNTPNEKVVLVNLVAEKEAAVRHNRDIDQLAKDYQASTDEMVRLAQAEAKMLEQLEKLRATMKDQEAATKAIEEQVKTAEKKDVSVIQSRIEQADQINAAVDAKARAQQLDQEIRRLTIESDKLTATIQKVDDDKQASLEAAEWPMEGMSLDADGILVNGLPLNQVNTASRTMISTLIGMRLNPKLRLLICENGNDLDLETLATLEKVCREHDFQMLLEMVTRSESDEALCSVIFEDGRIRELDPVAV